MTAIYSYLDLAEAGIARSILHTAWHLASANPFFTMQTLLESAADPEEAQVAARMIKAVDESLLPFDNLVDWFVSATGGRTTLSMPLYHLKWLEQMEEDVHEWQFAHTVEDDHAW